MVQKIFILVRLFLFYVGFYKVSYHKMSIREFIADYVPTQDTSHPAVAVSNHVSFLDMLVYLTKPVSFLSKLAVATSPLVGMFSVARQCVFLNRESKTDRESILRTIKKRADLGARGLLS